MKLRLAVLILLSAALASGCQPTTAPGTTAPAPPKSAQGITIEEWNASVGHVGISELTFTFDVWLANNSSRPIKIKIVSLWSGKSERSRMILKTLQPGEKKNFSLGGCLLERMPGSRELECKIRIGEDVGQIMSPIIAEKSITIPVPVAGIGYTEPVGMFIEKTLQETLPLTLISWMEGEKALAGPFEKGIYYTYTAKPGNRFITLVFELRNDWTKSQKIPHMWKGDILTDKGKIYSARQIPTDPAILTEYTTKAATEEEIDALVGYSGGYELPPGESIKGRIVFEVPQDENLVEASIQRLRPLIAYEGRR